MIKQVTLHNFKKWADLTIKFDDTVNILSGKTDSGKSVVIHALTWVIFNDSPVTDVRRDYIENGKPKQADDVFVEIIVEDSGSVHTIRRYNNKDGNGYIIDGKKLNAIGRGQVDAVVELLNFSDVNIQNQFDTMFLLADTGASVSEKINELLGLSDIDELTDSISKDIRVNRMVIKDVNDSLQTFSDTLSSYDKYDGVEELVEDLTIRASQLDVKIRDRDAIDKIIESFNSLQKQSGLLLTDDTLSLIETNLSTAYALLDKIQVLEFKDITNLLSDYNNVSQQLSSENSMDVVLPDEKITKIKSLHKQVTEVSKLLDSVKEINRQIDEVDILDEIYTEELNEIPRCPLCGSVKEICHE